jgi:dihydrofolate reductase
METIPIANYVYIAASIDGFIAEKDGGLDWLINIPNPDNSDYGFNDFIKRIDALIMGRNTYEKVLTFGEWIYAKKVFVLSNSIKSVSEEMTGKAEIVSGDIPILLSDLNRRGYNNFYVDGGKVIQSFLNEDLIDEMIITRVPILLGEGIPLFGKLDKPIKFSKVITEVFNNGLVKNHYIK